MSQPLKVLIVEDHPSVALGTREILEQIGGVTVVAIAETGKACVDNVIKYTPDVVFLDYNLPDQNGKEVTKQIMAIDEGIHVIIFTGVEYEAIYNDLIELRVSGILDKDSTAEQIKNMVASIRSEQTVLSLDLFWQLRMPEYDYPTLTQQEDELMKLVIEGYTYDQIAKQIYISKRTVDNYVKKVFVKLDATSRTQAVQKYIQMNKN